MKRYTVTILVLIAAIAAAFIGIPGTAGADAERPVGEKLTYTLSYGNFQNAGYAELQTVSKGKLEGRDAIEYGSRIKTFDFVAASLFLIDEARTVFVTPETDLPLYVRIKNLAGVVPEERTASFLDRPTLDHDFVSLIQHLRRTGGSGSFTVSENGEQFAVNAIAGISESTKTDAGVFETTLVSVTSEFFAKRKITDVRVNFSSDARRIPVLLRFRYQKNEFRASLAAIVTAPGTGTPTPTPAPTKQATPTPAPKATPRPYVPNAPLGAEIPFSIGENLEYRITANGQIAGTALFRVQERRQIQVGTGNRDSLLISANFVGADSPAQIFKNGDYFRTWVDPDDLQPIQSESKFGGALSVLNQTARFDQDRGVAVVDGNTQVLIPVNTHNLLSLFYAVRSFNLKPSKDATNPVNDTRVAVLYGNQFLVFMLRPSAAQVITLRGEKVSAQLVSVFTGNPQLDGLGIKFWFSNEKRRTPLRFSVGQYQADLVSESVVAPK